MFNQNILMHHFTLLRVLSVIFISSYFLLSADTYLLIVTEDQPPGDLIFNSSVYKLGSDRHYKINFKRSAAFVNSLLFVEPRTGQVFLRENLICDGIYYPNLFTLYIDSTSNRLRDIEYYSLPLRILVVGENCGVAHESWSDRHLAEEYRKKRNAQYDNSAPPESFDLWQSEHTQTNVFTHLNNSLLKTELDWIISNLSHSFPDGFHQKHTLFSPKNFDFKPAKLAGTNKIVQLRDSVGLSKPEVDPISEHSERQNLQDDNIFQYLQNQRTRTEKILKNGLVSKKPWTLGEAVKKQSGQNIAAVSSRSFGHENLTESGESVDFNSTDSVRNKLDRVSDSRKPNSYPRRESLSRTHRDADLSTSGIRNKLKLESNSVQLLKKPSKEPNLQEETLSIIGSFDKQRRPHREDENSLKSIKNKLDLTSNTHKIPGDSFPEPHLKQNSFASVTDYDSRQKNSPDASSAKNTPTTVEESLELRPQEVTFLSSTTYDSQESKSIENKVDLTSNTHEIPGGFFPELHMKQNSFASVTDYDSRQKNSPDASSTKNAPTTVEESLELRPQEVTFVSSTTYDSQESKSIENKLDLTSNTLKIPGGFFTEPHLKQNSFASATDYDSRQKNSPDASSTKNIPNTVEESLELSPQQEVTFLSSTTYDSKENNPVSAEETPGTNTKIASTSLLMTSYSLWEKNQISEGKNPVQLEELLDIDTPDASSIGNMLELVSDTPSALKKSHKEQSLPEIKSVLGDSSKFGQKFQKSASKNVGIKLILASAIPNMPENFLGELNTKGAKSLVGTSYNFGEDTQIPADKNPTLSEQKLKVDASGSFSGNKLNWASDASNTPEEPLGLNTQDTLLVAGYNIGQKIRTSEDKNPTQSEQKLNVDALSSFSGNKLVRASNTPNTPDEFLDLNTHETSLTARYDIGQRSQIPANKNPTSLKENLDINTSESFDGNKLDWVSDTPNAFEGSLDLNTEKTLLATSYNIGQKSLFPADKTRIHVEENFDIDASESFTGSKLDWASATPNTLEGSLDLNTEKTVLATSYKTGQKSKIPADKTRIHVEANFDVDASESFTGNKLDWASDTPNTLDLNTAKTLLATSYNIGQKSQSPADKTRIHVEANFDVDPSESFTGNKLDWASDTPNTLDLNTAKTLLATSYNIGQKSQSPADKTRIHVEANFDVDPSGSFTENKPDWASDTPNAPERSVYLNTEKTLLATSYNVKQKSQIPADKIRSHIEENFDIASGSFTGNKLDWASNTLNTLNDSLELNTQETLLAAGSNFRTKTETPVDKNEVQSGKNSDVSASGISSTESELDWALNAPDTSDEFLKAPNLQNINSVLSGRQETLSAAGSNFRQKIKTPVDKNAIHLGEILDASDISSKESELDWVLNAPHASDEFLKAPNPHKINSVLSGRQETFRQKIKTPLEKNAIHLGEILDASGISSKESELNWVLNAPDASDEFLKAPNPHKINFVLSDSQETLTVAGSNFRQKIETPVDKNAIHLGEILDASGISSTESELDWDLNAPDTSDEFLEATNPQKTNSLLSGSYDISKSSTNLQENTSKSSAKHGLVSTSNSFETPKGPFKNSDLRVSTSFDSRPKTSNMPEEIRNGNTSKSREKTGTTEPSEESRRELNSAPADAILEPNSPGVSLNGEFPPLTPNHLFRRRKRNIDNLFYIHADKPTRTRISEARQWISETYASFAIPTTDKWQKICLKRSQFINSISAFIPKTISQQCVVNYLDINDNRFAIEKSQGDLVARDDVCISEPMWKVIVTFSTQCRESRVLDSEHRLKIVYHHQEFNDTDIAKRVRRELRNQSPFFEQALYMASVLEECDPGVVVTTVKARDPENSPVTYHMTSLLDSRTQGMFDIDSKMGTVITKVKLDRELLDVHYFRVTAVDDSFPPRSGTTTLQINVIDANDHGPVFEMNEYDASVREGVSIGTTVITLKATDQDVGKNAEVEYTLQSVSGGGMSSPESDSQAFRVDARTGVITTRTLLDRETTEVYTLVVQASDQASPQNTRRTSTATVVVHVLDDNDNYPQFTERTYTINVNEDTNWAENPVIAHVKATDADQGNNAAIRYAIIGGNTQSQFSIDSLTGDISLVKQLDYETLRSYRLVIRAQDGGSPSRSNTTQLLINVKDVNDNAPRFYTSLFQESVSESVPVGFSIVRVQAYDADEGPNSDIRYSLAPRDSTGGSTDEIPLSVDSHNGWIITTRELDREEQSKYMFQVIASDQGNPPLSASASVVVTIQDVNDNDPVFEPKIYEAVVSEDDQPGTPVASVTATDADEDQRLHYELTGGNTRGRFSITSQNGRGLITVAQPLDYKQEKRYILTVTATDSGGRHDTATVYVNISDANNFAPVFENAPYTATVFEDAPVGTTVLVVSATDNDVGINAQITYTLGDELSSSSDQASEFSINPQTGAIITTKSLDRETLSGYLLTVTARDGGNPPLSDTTDVEISVTDVNDNYPTFKQRSYSGNILEDALIGTSVVQVSATDADIGLNGRIRYILSDKDTDDGTFMIDPTSGVIRTNKGLDRESVAMYELQAIAVDRGSPALSSEVPVMIRIEDINDSPPAFDTDKIVLYIPENSPIGSTVGLIHAEDPDEGVNGIVQYSIIGGDDSNSFSLVTRPGSESAELLTMTELDYESPRKKYDLVIRAASPPLRSDVHVEVIVTDVNDNAPILKDFYVMFNNFRDCFPTGTIGRIPAFDADVSDRLRYRILSGNNAQLVTLNETNGELLLSPQLNTNVPKVASMEVSVTDGVNDVKAVMQLSVRLITEDMLFNSITVRLNYMTKEAFLSPLLGFFIDGLAAIIPCPKENIFVFSIQEDTDVNAKILNVSFSARRPDVSREEYYSPQFLQERVYLNRAILARLSTVQVLPFDDNLCVREPCLNYEECLTILRFGNASEFIHSDTVLFRPIYPVTAFACHCPDGFTGSKEPYLCDTEVNMCYSNPCINNGTCYRREGGYSCSCLAGFTGVNCEVILHQDPCKRDICKSGSTCTPLAKGGFICEDCTPGGGGYEHYTALCELRARSFSKSSFLTFPSLRQRHRLHISLRFATQSPNGILLYNGRYNEKHDFIALEIINGEVQFSFSLGSNVTRTTVTIPGGVADGNWHTITINYYNKTATVSLDECDTMLAIKHGSQLGWRWACANSSTQVLEARCAVLTETCHRFLDLTGPFQVGGLPRVPSDFQVANLDYVGCIADIYIDHRFVDLNSFVADNGTMAGCPEKREFCSSNPCRNGGTCREGWSTYKCDCAQGFGGKDCSDLISQPWRFSGDGTLSFNPLLRPIQLPWLNAISVRTLQADTFLMSIQVGQNSSAVVALKAGLLHYSYNGLSLNLTSKPLSDGSWHHLEVTWLGTEVRLNVDYGQYVSVVPFSPKIQGLYVGKILIGGPDGTYSSLNAGYSYFEGCIQDVRIGNQQSSLNRPTVREHVEDGCQASTDCTIDCPSTAECVGAWGDSRCECRRGFVGPLCGSICDVSPCNDAGVCVHDMQAPRGYTCRCNGSEYSGEYCETRLDQPCPSGWWGYPVCGPCSCDVNAGYNSDCDKKTGECRCKENHWRPTVKKTIGTNHKGKEEVCRPCECYTIGSFSPQCDLQTGQCRCRTGVIGQRCDSCPNPYAEVTLRGCEVVYDGCPRSYAGKLWWPRTPFGETAIESCPKGSHGKASRSCDNQLGGWQKPDMFNCTSELFMELRKQLSQIEKGELLINTYVAIKMADDLHRATNHTPELYGADVLITQQLIRELLKHEAKEAGLNLTHSQDKDYIANIAHSASAVLDDKYFEEWDRIEDLTGDSTEALILSIYNYIGVLAHSQRDTYTNPFEIVSTNMALGLDVVTAVSLFGYEPDHIPLHHPSEQTFTTERVIIPDTSEFLKPGIETSPSVKPSPVIAFPKYNNYLKDDSKFDMNSKFLVPLYLLGIKPLEVGELTTKNSLPDSGAIVSYAQYKQAGSLLPPKYDESVMRRWGIDVCIGSPVISISILVPEYIEAVTKPPPGYDQRRKIVKKTFSDEPETKHENSAYLRKTTLTRRKRSDYDLSKKLFYKSLSGIPLSQPIRIQIALNTDQLIFNERSNPQCVHWSTVRGKGEWSRVGCRTELDQNWMDKTPLIVNCTCNHLSSFAVLVDIIDLEYIPEPSLLESVSSYSCFSISLPLLLCTWLVLSLLRGGAQTNSNTIHKHLVLCVFLAQLLYFIALKARRPLIENPFPCKLVAIALHYLWLCVFAWNLVDAIHLYRMLTEMRDINHGQMPFYFTVGYVLPAVVVSLPVGARVDQYGNYYFCWLSLYESVVWSLTGPVSAAAGLNLAVLALSVRAAFTLKDHVLGFGNLRTLLWLSVVSLPLLVMMWVLALLMASDHEPLLTYLLSLVVLIHAIFSVLGYCFVNSRVRQNLFRTVMYCMGKKVPLLETTSVIGGASTSSHNINMQSSRSALAYHSGTSGFEASSRRHVGISTSSTTSRSTTKTGSSPYRSDTHLRHNTTSTSTSNYNSTSDVPGGYLHHLHSQHQTHHRHREGLEESGRRRGDSESDSDASEGRSLELASSHSSDDDESTSTGRRQHRSATLRAAGTSTVGYLPNITEHVVSRCGTPPALNVVTNSQLFPNIHQPYAGRWSSQLPETYLPNSNVGEIGRWSAETGSDNELHCHKTNSPNPLPHPDVTPDSYLPTGGTSSGAMGEPPQYMLNTQQYHLNHNDPHYVQKLMKHDYHTSKLADNYHHEYADHGSETEEKHHVGDKYLFPYTAEEDHCGTGYHHQQLQPSSRLVSPVPLPLLGTNDINNPPDYHRMLAGPGSDHTPGSGSRLGSVMGSVCGGSARASPSHLGPSPAPLAHSQHQLHDTQEKDANAETSV